MDYLCIENQTRFCETRLNRTRGTQTERALYDDSRTSDLPSNFAPPTGDRRDCAEAKRRQEKEAAAGASA